MGNRNIFTLTVPSIGYKKSISINVITTKITWLKPNTEEVCQRVRLAGEVDLLIEISGNDKSTIEVVLEKEDGTRLKTFDETIEEDGSIKIKGIKIEQAWISDAQKIVARVIYGRIEKKSELLEIGRIVSGVWLNEKNEELTQNAEKLNDTFFYGQKAKIKINTVHLEEDTIIKVTLKGLVEGKDVDFPKIQTGKKDSKIEVELQVKKDEAISEEIYIHPLWYNEEIEEYDYINHITKIEATKSLTLLFDAQLEEEKQTIMENLPEAEENQLRPVTYRRNYEELIGLFDTNNSKNKTRVNNYEDKFIKESAGIPLIVEDFITKITDKETTATEIENLVKTKAAALWQTAVAEVQAGKLDDRPLYWARNKMQTYLKRHPIYKSDYDFEKSTVSKGSDLETIITKFEAKSRNYYGIDFSKAIADPVKIAKAEIEMKKAEKLLEDATKLYLADTTGNKQLETDHKLAQEAHKKAKEALEKSKKVFKVLITGFDPFVLNPNHLDTKGEISRQNPSGITTLHFHGKTIDNVFIQCVILPVRYKDFDNGVVEDITKANINSFDTMMTASQNESTFDLERLACKFRGGFLDNLNIGTQKPSYNSNGFKQISSGEEFYETTLPISKILVGDLAAHRNIVYFDQSYKLKSGKERYHPILIGVKSNTISKSYDLSILKGKSEKGSGSNYLSNEVMYRTTRLRNDLKLNDKKQIGHVHITRGLSPSIFLSIVKKIIQNAHK